MPTLKAPIAVFILAVTTLGCSSSNDDSGSMASPQQAAGMSAAASGAGAGGDGVGTSGAGGAADMTTAAAGAAGSPTLPSGEADYSQPANWLCRPGHNGPCEANLDATVVQADGTVTVETFAPHPSPPIDCFYVYPTVSLDATPNSDLVPGPEEEGVVRAQFARLGSQCRLFAPMYRQVTLTSLRAALGGMGTAAPPDRVLGYNDVVAAWRYYLENDNQGRGVVLVGHSQGSGVLTRLITAELDKAPLDQRFVAALLLGTTVTVPDGAAVGGTFQNVPLCTAPEQLGCVVVYASFRATAPPPAGALFGSSRDPNLVAACTNPAALGGGKAELHAYLSAQGPGASSNPMAPWVQGGAAVETPFVSAPGLLSAECVFGTNGYYLAITVNADPADPRADDITGDVVTNGAVQAGWGLHLLDAHLAMGNLVSLVQAKAQAHGGS
jgi:hypothetical protein